MFDWQRYIDTCKIYLHIRLKPIDSSQNTVAGAYLFTDYNHTMN